MTLHWQSSRALTVQNFCTGHVSLSLPLRPSLCVPSQPAHYPRPRVPCAPCTGREVGVGMGSAARFAPAVCRLRLRRPIRPISRGGGGQKRESEQRGAGARTRSPGRRMSSGAGETLNALDGANVAIVAKELCASRLHDVPSNWLCHNDFVACPFLLPLSPPLPLCILCKTMSTPPCAIGNNVCCRQQYADNQNISFLPAIMSSTKA